MVKHLQTKNADGKPSAHTHTDPNQSPGILTSSRPLEVRRMYSLLYYSGILTHHPQFVNRKFIPIFYGDKTNKQQRVGKLLPVRHGCIQVQLFRTFVRQRDPPLFGRGLAIFCPFVTAASKCSSSALSRGSETICQREHPQASLHRPFMQQCASLSSPQL